MAFLNKIKSTQLPPIKNILNVAVQTARQHMPDKKDYEQPGGVSSGMAEPNQQHNHNEASDTQAMYQGDETNYGTGKTFQSHTKTILYESVYKDIKRTLKNSSRQTYGTKSISKSKRLGR